MQSDAEGVPKVLRVLLANLPRILAQILRDLVSRQPDMAIVGEVRALAEVPAAVASLQAEAVIVAASERDLVRSVAVLRDRDPALTFLCLAPAGDRAVLCSPHAPPRPFELSASGVLGALRAHHGTGGREAIA